MRDKYKIVKGYKFKKRTVKVTMELHGIYEPNEKEIEKAITKYLHEFLPKKYKISVEIGKTE